MSNYDSRYTFGYFPLSYSYILVKSGYKKESKGRNYLTNEIGYKKESKGRNYLTNEIGYKKNSPQSSIIDN